MVQIIGKAKPNTTTEILQAGCHYLGNRIHRCRRQYSGNNGLSAIINKPEHGTAGLQNANRMSKMQFK